MSRKIKVTLSELRNADVTHVSLVDRAASRIPFRVMKSDKENQMLDLTKPHTAFKSDAPEDVISVAAVIIDGSNEAFATKAVEVLAAHGFAVDKVTKNDDNTILFAQGEATTGTVLRISENMLVVMKGFDSVAQTLKDNSDFVTTTEKGYFEGVSAALEGVSRAVKSQLLSAMPLEEMAESVNDSLSEFNAYTIGLVSSIPSQVFKADAALAEIAPVVETAEKGDILEITTLLHAAPLGSDGTAWSAMSTIDKIKWMLASYTKANTAGAQKGEFPPKDADGDNDGSKDGDTEEEKPEGMSQEEWDAKQSAKPAKPAKTAKAETPDFAAMIASAMSAALEPMSTTLKTIAAKQEAQDKKSTKMNENKKRKSHLTLCIVWAPAFLFTFDL